MKKLIKLAVSSLGIIQIAIFGAIIQKWDMQYKYNLEMYNLPKYPDRMEILLAAVFLLTGIAIMAYITSNKEEEL